MHKQCTMKEEWMKELISDSCIFFPKNDERGKQNNVEISICSSWFK